MKTITINTYGINELEGAARERALSWLAAGTEYPWHHENVDSLKAFLEAFGLRIRDVSYEYGGRGSHCTLKQSIVWENDEGETITGQELADRLSGMFDLSGNGPFTGYCMDETLLDGIRAFIKKPDDSTSIQEIVAGCLEDWASACNADYEATFTEEALIEFAECNDYQFDEDGRIV